jgi:hypothetical protein
MNPHDVPPQTTTVPPPEAREAVERIQASGYFASLAPLPERVAGRRVVRTGSGTSGFYLEFHDDSWVLAYLDDDVLKWTTGTVTHGYPENDLLAMSSPKYGDGHLPLASGFFADGICDISAELEKSVGAVVEGISIGENTFNFRFSGGRELETVIGPTHDGKLALRVFWEQW